MRLATTEVDAVRTVIVRLSPPSGDGRLHGLVEVVGGEAVAFTDDDLLAALHRVNRREGRTGS